MPCNLAVSIQYAQIDDTDIRQAMTAEMLQPILAAWAADYGLTEVETQISPAYRAHSAQPVAPNALWLEVGRDQWGETRLTVMYRDGTVQTTGRDRDLVRLASASVLGVINDLAYELTGAKLEASLGDLGALLTRTTADITDDQGQPSTVNVFTLAF